MHDSYLHNEQPTGNTNLYMGIKMKIRLLNLVEIMEITTKFYVAVYMHEFERSNSRLSKNFIHRAVKNW